MMSLLSRLTGTKDDAGKAKGPATAAGRPLQAARRDAANQPNAQAKVTPIRQPAQRPQAQPPFYRSVNELPPHVNVASMGGGRFVRSEAQRTNMFILELTETPDTFAVVTTRDHFGGAAYKAAIADILAAGCKPAHCGTADGALINRIYAERRETKADEASKPIEKDIDRLVQEALDQDVSDIHIESRSTGVIVRMRINGRLQMYSDSWETEYATTMARSMHTIADDDSKPTSFSTDCQMSISRTLPSGQRVKLRVQISPAYPDDGMDITLRVLRVAASAKVKTLEALGYAPDHIEMLEYMLSSPHGLIVIAGTTGSGKSTTLQTAMANIRMADRGRKLISIEDPPEYVLEGVTQIPVARRKDSGAEGKNPFAAAMRNTMRMDPDVIMIGEIRDAESAGLMVSMNQSGHKVLTTIHAESSIGILGRLRGMSVQSDVLASRGFISGLIFQTLVPTLCPHCRVDYSPGMSSIPEAMHERIRHVVREGDTLFVESDKGCPHCKNTGIAGRTVCAEMVIPDGTMRDHIMDNNMKAAHTHWRSQRNNRQGDSMLGASALDHAILKMRRGEVSPAAVEGALGLLHDYSQEADLMGQASELLGLGD